jgi:GNAT superfamily N-acetyltransferase
MRIRSYTPADRKAVLDLSIRAWTPVFAAMPGAVPSFVYRNFYPEGWEARQIADLAAVLDDEAEGCDVLEVDGSVVGWICTRLHPEDAMGEVYVLAVDPDHQGRGYGTALMRHAEQRVAAAGMRMVMVETGGDPGHALARAAYESAGYRRWPVARYFKDLTE